LINTTSYWGNILRTYPCQPSTTASPQSRLPPKESANLFNRDPLFLNGSTNGPMAMLGTVRCS